MGDPSETFGRSWDDLWRSSGASLEAFEAPERSFGLAFHVFLMPIKDPGDLKDSMVFIRREAIEVVSSEVPFSKKCFGMTCVTYWRSLGGLGRSFGGL